MKQLYLSLIAALILACEPQPLPEARFFAGATPASDAGADATGDASTDTAADTTVDALPDASSAGDSGPDADGLVDGGAEVSADVLADSTVDAGADSGPEVLADSDAGADLEVADGLADAALDADSGSEVAADAPDPLDGDAAGADLGNDATPGCSSELATCNGLDDDCDGQTDEDCGCANAAYLAPDCTACAEGYEAVPTAQGQACAADFPAWGARPDSPPSGWFADQGNGTVFDTQSKLLWEKGFSPAGQTWDAAQKYCFGLSLGGFKDWRMPTAAELTTLRDLNKAAPAIVGAFAGTPSDFFWTAMPVQLVPSEAWSVFFSAGMTTSADKSSPFHVRCVR